MLTTTLVRGKQLRDVTAAVLASEVDAIATRPCPSCGSRKGRPCIRGGTIVYPGRVNTGDPGLVLYACRERFYRDPWWWLR